MAEFDFRLTATAPLPGPVTIGANRIAALDLSILSVAVPQGGDDAAKTALQKAYGLDWPGAVESSTSGDLRAISVAPDAIWILGADAGKAADKLGGAAYLTDLTDGHVVLELEGPDVAAALERLTRLDWERMPDSAATRTQVEHLSVTILRPGPGRCLFIAGRSMAGSLLHAVDEVVRNVAADTAATR